jgi:hypothetical protein
VAAVHWLFGCGQYFKSNLLHPLEDSGSQALLAELRCQDFVERGEGQSVSGLVLLVVHVFFLPLETVVGQVDEGVFGVGVRVGDGGGAEVGFGVEVNLVGGSDQDPGPDVEFAALI